jgi:glycosyltransferase involved in cell wall biosynthesis
MARRVLFIAYFFPPLGGGGVQRSVKFVRYLREFGYEPVVLTGPGHASGRWAPRDETLGADLPDGIEVHRVPGPEPSLSAGWRWRAERLLGAPAPFDRWWERGVVELGSRVGDGTDLVFGELVPYLTARPAERLARELDKPWVADLQDPWALDEMWLYPTAAHRLRDRARMRSLLRTAAAVVMNTPEAALRVRRSFPEFRDRSVASIPNGFDAADFEPPVTPRTDGSFRIVHTGYLYTERKGETGLVRRALGGLPVRGVNYLTRSHIYLLQAVRRVLEADPSLERTIEVHLAGPLTSADKAVIDDAPFVREHGYLPHAETLQLTRTADLLFLPMQELPPGQRAGLVPGKTYEYLASGRPILAAVPEGDAKDLLAEAGSALICGPSDVASLTLLIEQAVERWRRGEPSPPPAAHVVARYERRHQTSQLAELFDEVLAAKPQ